MTKQEKNLIAGLFLVLIDEYAQPNNKLSLHRAEMLQLEINMIFESCIKATEEEAT